MMLYPLKYFWKLKPCVLLVLLSFPVSVFASDYIIPDICINRATDIGVFRQKDPVYTSQALQKNFSGTRDIDYKAMAIAYETSLLKLNENLSDSQSDIFQYLVRCQKNAADCHGYFIQKLVDWKNISFLKNVNGFMHPIALQLYCDATIYQSMIKSAFDDNYQIHQNIISNPNSYNAVSFERLKSSTDSISTVLTKRMTEFSDLINRIRHQSVMPDGFAFVLAKIDEEFSDIPGTQKKIKLIETAKELQSCCGNTSALPTKFQTAANTLVQSGDQIGLENQNYDMLWFRAYDHASSILLDKGEEDYWKKKVSGQTFSKMKVQDQIDFFKFLMSHPFFYRDFQKNSYQEVRNSIQKNRNSFSNIEISQRNQYFLWNPKTLQYEDGKEIQAYKTSIGYRATPSTYEFMEKYGEPPTGWPRDLDVRAIYGSNQLQGMAAVASADRLSPFVMNMMFNRSFANDYMSFLNKKLHADLQQKMLSAIDTQSKSIFLGYIPFVFNRDAKQIILRDLQKYREDYADKNILNSKVNFLSWADRVVCDPTYFDEEKTYEHFNDVKKEQLSQSYCSSKNIPGRRAAYVDLYNMIMLSGEPIHFQPPQGAKYSRYVYNRDQVAQIDKVMRLMNDFCWKNYDPSGYQKSPAKYNNHADFTKLINNFLVVAGDELLSKTPFLKSIHFDPQTATQQCFTEGHAFGTLQISSTGASISSSIAAASAGYVSDLQALQQVPFKVKYALPTIILNKKVMDSVEQRIEAEVVKDMENVHTAIEKSEDDVAREDFMKTAVTIHTLATVDFLRDNPSPVMARYFGNLIKKEIVSQQLREQWTPFFTTLLLAGTAIVSVGVLPAIFTGAAITAFDGATAAVFYIGGSALTISQIIRIRHENKEIDRSRNLRDLDPEIVQILKKLNSNQISSLWVQEGIQSALVLVLASRPISIFGRFVNNLFDADFKFLIANIRTDLERYVEKTGVSNKFLVSDDFIDFLATKATQEDRIAFLKLLNEHDTPYSTALQDFIETKWGTALGPIPSFTIVKSPTILQKISSTLSDFGNFLFKRKIFYEIKIGWYRLCEMLLAPGNPIPGTTIYPDAIRFYLYDQLALQTNIKEILNNAIVAGRMLGRKIYTDEDLSKMEKKLTFFKRDQGYSEGILADGLFHRVMARDLKVEFDDFIAKYPFLQTNPKLAQGYLKIAMNEELVDRTQWMKIFRNFTGEINSESDLKSLLKVLKVAHSRYTGISQQLDNLGELINPKEIFSGPVVYPNRVDYIIDHINQFFQVAQSWKFDVSNYTVTTLKTFATENGVTIDEILAKIQAFDTRGEVYEYNSILRTLETSTTHVSRATVMNDKYLVQFWDQEQINFENFKRVFDKDLKKALQTMDATDAFATAYLNAKSFVRRDKKLRSGCSLPGSVIKGGVSERYGQFLNSIAATASGVNYAVVHRNEDKDTEWWVRGGFEIAGAYVVNKLFLSPIYSSGGNYSPITRDFIFYPLTVAAGITLDGTMYQATVEKFYNGNAKYEAEFKKLIYESDDLQQTVEAFFKRHPDVEKKLTDNIKSLEKTFYDLEKSKRAGETVNDEMVEKAFVKQHLYDKYFADQTVSNPTEQQILDVMQSVLYQEADHKQFDPDQESDYDTDGMVYDRGTENRMSFNATTYEPNIAVFALAKNGLIFNFLCYGRYLPAPAALAMALGTYTIYKSGVDMYKFNKREQLTGH